MITLFYFMSVYHSGGLALDIKAGLVVRDLDVFGRFYIWLETACCIISHP